MYQLVPEHLLCVEVCDEKADIVTLNLLPPQDYKVLGSPHHKTHELVTQKFLDVVSLFDGDRNSNRVNAWLYQDPFLLVPGDDHRVEEEHWRLLDLNLRLVVSLNLLAGEVLQTHGGLQGPLDTQQVGLQGVGHHSVIVIV